MTVKKYKHTKHGIGAFWQNFKDFPGTEPFFVWIRIRIVFAWIRIPFKVRSGSGSVSKLYGSATLGSGSATLHDTIKSYKYDSHVLPTRSGAPDSLAALSLLPRGGWPPATTIHATPLISVVDPEWFIPDPDPALNFPRSGSGSRQKLRIHADPNPDPTHII